MAARYSVILYDMRSILQYTFFLLYSFVVYFGVFNISCTALKPFSIACSPIFSSARKNSIIDTNLHFVYNSSCFLNNAERWTWLENTFVPFLFSTRKSLIWRRWLKDLWLAREQRTFYYRQTINEKNRRESEIVFRHVQRNRPFSRSRWLKCL